MDDKMDDIEITKRCAERMELSDININGGEVVIGVTRFAPLATAGIDAAHVGAFWDSQIFDLKLPNVGGRTRHGNCDLCFLKGGQQILSLVREQPERAVWWAKMERYAKDTFVMRETDGGWRFRMDRASYGEMHSMATKHGEMFPFDDSELEDCACTD